MVEGYNFFESAVPWAKITASRNRWYLRNWVELGAGYGHQSAIATDIFAHVHCVEVDPEVFKHQVHALTTSKNVARYCGTTLQHIPEILAKCVEPTCWFIDSHYPGVGPKLGPECPLLDELRLIGERPNDCFFIDNLGMFAHPPRPPHDPTQWPRLDQVLEMIREVNRLFPMTYFDTIVATPEPAITI